MMHWKEVKAQMQDPEALGMELKKETLLEMVRLIEFGEAQTALWKDRCKKATKE